MAGGVLIHEDSAKRIFDVTRRVEGEPLDLTRNNDRRRVQTSLAVRKSYFYPKKTAVNKIKIVDGFDVDNANCGNISVNKLALAAVVATELTIAADAFIYLECLGVGDPLTSSTNTIEQYEEEQSWEAGKEKILISRVLATAPVAPATKATITNFSIEPVPSRIGIKGACD